MSEETKVAHISGRYHLLGICLTALFTFLLGLPIGLNLEKTKGAAEISQISQKYSIELESLNEELGLLNKKYADLTKLHEDSIEQLSQLDSRYFELLDLYNNALSENTRLTKLLEDNENSAIPYKPNNLDQHASELLSNLIPVSGTMDWDRYKLWDVANFDNYGNKYTSGILMRQKFSEKFHLVYALDNKFSKLTGKFVLSDDGKNTDGHYTLYAYSLVNGNMYLLYESKVLATATRPIDVEIDVTGVMDLVIEMYDSNKSNENAWTAFVNATLE